MNKSFAELLRVERARKKKSLKTVAEEIGYSTSYLSLIEQDKRVLREPVIFARLCKALDIEIDQVIEAVGADLRKEINEELRKL